MQTLLPATKSTCKMEGRMYKCCAVLGHFHLILLLSIIDWTVSIMVICTNNYYNLENLESFTNQEGYLTGGNCAFGCLCHGTVFPQKLIFNWKKKSLLLRYLKVHYCLCRRLLLDPVLSQTNYFHNFTSFFLRYYIPLWICGDQLVSTLAAIQHYCS